MSAVWLRARAQLRGRARATVLLAVLVGLAGGMILAAVAGARRSNAALPRFLAFSHTVDAIVWVFPRSGSPFESRSDLAEESPLIAGLPGVQGVHRGAVLILSGTDPASRSGPSRQLALVELDPARGELLGRPMIVAGRLPRGDRPEEVTVDEELAGRRGLRVGSAYRIGLYTLAQFGPAGEGVPIQPGGPAVELRVVGIVRQPRDLLPLADGTEEIDTEDSSSLYLTPAFWGRYGPDLAKYGIFFSVELHQGPADLPAFTTALQRRYGDRAFINNNALDEPGDVTIVGVRRAIAVESAGPLGVAGLAALAASLLVGQTLGRQIFLEAAEYPTLRGLGMTRASWSG